MVFECEEVDVGMCFDHLLEYGVVGKCLRGWCPGRFFCEIFISVAGLTTMNP